MQLDVERNLLTHGSLSTSLIELLAYQRQGHVTSKVSPYLGVCVSNSGWGVRPPDSLLLEHRDSILTDKALQKKTLQDQGQGYDT